MAQINYDQIANKYDNMREAEVRLINLFLEEVNIDESDKVLDFGCGTANYTDKLDKLTEGEIFGVDPSEGMIKKAEEKNQNIIFKQGNHEHIPFPANHFDFIYMTDVIHHIPEIDKMFKETYRTLKPEGKLCIVTESHDQIERRFIVDYFPETAEVDKERYPTIKEITANAVENGFIHIENITIGENEEIKVDEDFLRLVQNKGYSMLHLISDSEYKRGLKRIKEDLNNGKVIKVNSGGTLVWLGK